MVPYSEMEEIDKWALNSLNKLVEKVSSAYESYEFHMIYHNIHNFCVVDMSNVYLDIIKDRLYTHKADSKSRRSAQSAMYIVLDSLVKLIAPFLCYTSEEIWSYMPHVKSAEEFSVLMNDMPKVNAEYANSALEEARAEKKIGKSLEASVAITAKADFEFLKSIEESLAEIFIVSSVSVSEGEDNITIAAAEGEKCERCWTVSKSVGTVAAHPTICARCAANLE